jgi:hypothetical protein
MFLPPAESNHISNGTPGVLGTVLNVRPDMADLDDGPSKTTASMHLAAARMLLSPVLRCPSEALKFLPLVTSTAKCR